MPATSQVRYYKSRHGYYTQIDRKQHRLATGPKDEPNGPTYREAVEKFAELTALAGSNSAEDENLVVTVFERYAQHLRSLNRMAALRMFMSVAKSASECFGHLQIRELKLAHIKDWLDKMGQERFVARKRKKLKVRWNNTHKNIAAAKIQACLNWAVTIGMTKTCILHHKARRMGLGLEKVASRGVHTVLTDDEQTGIIADAHPSFRDLLVFLAGTGCRPGEAVHAVAANYDRELGAIVHRANPLPGQYVHKNARTGKDRVILLAPDLRELVERLIAEYPEGPIFRNRDGGVWTPVGMCHAFRRICKRLKIKKQVIAYSFRHTFATRWIEQGGSIKILADLMGNSVKIIEETYCHADPARYKERLEAFRQWQLEKSKPKAAAM